MAPSLKGLEGVERRVRDSLVKLGNWCNGIIAVKVSYV